MPRWWNIDSMWWLCTIWCLHQRHYWSRIVMIWKKTAFITVEENNRMNGAAKSNRKSKQEADCCFVFIWMLNIKKKYKNTSCSVCFISVFFIAVPVVLVRNWFIPRALIDARCIKMYPIHAQPFCKTYLGKKSTNLGKLDYYDVTISSIGRRRQSQFWDILIVTSYIM